MILRDLAPGTRFTTRFGDTLELVREIDGGAVGWCRYVGESAHTAVVSLSEPVTIVGPTVTNPRYGTRVPKGPSGGRTPRNAYGGDQLVQCRVCGCTDDDCRGCIERMGQPCYWVEPGLCSACAGSASAHKPSLIEIAVVGLLLVGAVVGIAGWASRGRWFEAGAALVFGLALAVAVLPGWLEKANPRAATRGLGTAPEEGPRG